jgi:hypothetical protein
VDDLGDDAVGQPGLATSTFGDPPYAVDPLDD